MRKLLQYFLLLIVTNPYSDLDYENPQAYYFEDQIEYQIRTYESDYDDEAEERSEQIQERVMEVRSLMNGGLLYRR